MGFMHKALLYEALPDGKVRCTACKQACTIGPGHTGICGVRMNKDGTLYLLVYGKASAVNIDPVEKKPLFHFLPGTEIFSLGTAGCNFACSFCQNWDISQVSKEIKKNILQKKRPDLMEVEITSLGYELPPEKIVELCAAKGIPSIAYTYNEPVIFFEYLYDTAKLAKKHGIKNVMVSNGYESDIALDHLKGYIDAMNIDLKAYTDDFYRKLCHGKLEPVLDTIRHAKKLGIWVEITTLVIPGQNDRDLQQIAAFIASVDPEMPWHITAFHPDYAMTDTPMTPHTLLIEGYDLGKKAGLKHVYLGNVQDEERSSTYCPQCSAMLIRRSGYHIDIQKCVEGKCTQCGHQLPGIWN